MEVIIFCDLECFVWMEGKYGFWYTSSVVVFSKFVAILLCPQIGIKAQLELKNLEFVSGFNLDADLLRLPVNEIPWKWD